MRARRSTAATSPRCSRRRFCTSTPTIPRRWCSSTRLALRYRSSFHKDVVIDLVCYRRQGHNEADEPAATQPVMYRAIRQHPTARKIYADQLMAAGVVSEADEPTDERAATARARCGPAAGARRARHDRQQVHRRLVAYRQVDWTEHVRDRRRSDAARCSSASASLHLPAELHAASARRAGARATAAKMSAGEMPLDWGCAETLAYASLLEDGYSVRLSGQDSGRGTFFHRHAVLHDQDTDATLHAAAAHPRRAAAVHSDRLGAVGGGGARLRVRLSRPRARIAGDLGGAVRRLRQRRAGRHRSVHLLGRGQVGAPVRPDAVAAARLRGQRVPSIPRRASSASCSCAPRTTCRCACPRRRRRCFTCCAGRCCAASASRSSS